MKASMEALILSDTHGRRSAVAGVLAQLNFRPSVILFLGDGLRDVSWLESDDRYATTDLYAVSGNCDSIFSYGLSVPPAEQMVLLGETRVMLMHGHTHMVRHGLGGAICHAAQREADVLLYGHTHVPYEATLARGTVLADGTVLQKPLLVANPGSLGEPRNGSEPSFGVLTVRDGQVLFSHGRYVQ